MLCLDFSQNIVSLRAFCIKKTIYTKKTPKDVTSSIACLFQPIMWYIYIKLWEFQSWNWEDSFLLIVINCSKQCFKVFSWTDQNVLTVPSPTPPPQKIFSMVSFNLLIQNFQSKSKSLRKWLQGTACTSNNKPGFWLFLVKIRYQIYWNYQG